MYKAAYQGLHSTDPNAAGDGDREPVPRQLRHVHVGHLNPWRARLWNYIDAVATHATGMRNLSGSSA